MRKAQLKDNPALPDATPPLNYEAALAELEALLARMEEGHLSLEDSLAAYRRGTALIAYCRAQLEHVEQQVRALDGEALQAFRADEGALLNSES
ncbi:Exodeoxyribonuclease VII small subunit (Exonuclease VII small subunit) (XseB) [Candidatus Glomeribacter gigasporarum BEG34]|uniref:Exodeoxyribonuclease 7 small subunit n=1 Tax=Candidatus Glomeribacter gigasporarum BEG34 TaxID=1070319 RepID=G2J8L6_9BURK|nr:exodeoxyribonuclease VII small subunit [Candidatus Glomeribacter gigasporarum]CCD29113.1 Exodeoxyribonuclease VII small subunit (Exonuclease VII small subunit) (XseB) [Candidatus Glomeribacter gigasporarum BEG34]